MCTTNLEKYYLNSNVLSKFLKRKKRKKLIPSRWPIFFKDLLVPGFTVTFAVLRCFIRKCTQRTCLAGFKATATSQGENAPACEPSRKFISWTLSRYSTWVEYERHGWFTEMNPVWWKTLAARGFSIVVRLVSAKLPARAT